MMTIPTFTRLLAMRMVASNSFEFSSRWTILLFTAVFDERISFNCDGDSEKNAVSEAEAAAEHNKRAMIAIMPAIRPEDEARSFTLKFNKTSAINASGSGSATV